MREASVLGELARDPILRQATRQAKYMTPMRADQLACVGNTKTAAIEPVTVPQDD
jgi:hypothetical protein